MVRPIIFQEMSKGDKRTTAKKKGKEEKFTMMNKISIFILAPYQHWRFLSHNFSTLDILTFMINRSYRCQICMSKAAFACSE